MNTFSNYELRPWDQQTASDCLAELATTYGLIYLLKWSAVATTRMTATASQLAAPGGGRPEPPSKVTPARPRLQRA